MKLKATIHKGVSVLLAIALLTNCTAYRPVMQSPSTHSADKEIILQMDDLKFRLVDYFYRSDTIVARISHDITDPPKSKRLILVMKKDHKPLLDSQGRTLVPFSSVEYMEYYEVDKAKSKKDTIILSCCVVAGGILVVLVTYAFAVSQLLNPDIWERGD